MLRHEITLPVAVAKGDVLVFELPSYRLLSVKRKPIEAEAATEKLQRLEKKIVQLKTAIEHAIASLRQIDWPAREVMMPLTAALLVLQSENVLNAFTEDSRRLLTRLTEAAEAYAVVPDPGKTASETLWQAIAESNRYLATQRATVDDWNEANPTIKHDRPLLDDWNEANPADIQNWRP